MCVILPCIFLLVANQGFYTALFKFPCFSSCLPKDSYHLAQIIFTLEYRNDILGRACVDIRVCASPGRDRKVAEEAIETPPANKKCKRKGFIDSDKNGIGSYIDLCNILHC